MESQEAEPEQNRVALSMHVADKPARLRRITGIGWWLLNFYGRRIKYPYLLPLYRLYGRVKYSYLLPIYRFLGLMPQSAESEQIPATENALRPVLAGLWNQRAIAIKGVADVPPLEAHRTSADVIVCVHNAFEDVKRCLESVLHYTRMPYTLILVDDGSDEKTSEYLASFAVSHQVTLIRNENVRGYTFAANQGLRQSRGDYVILLNSDTVVTPDWLDRMIACGESDPHIGLVGPLSNAATWQSIPEVISGEEFAHNKLPEGLTVTDMGKLVADYSARLYPRLPFLNGFCLMINRQVIDEIGYFDEEAFGRGYGEENDYGLRASKGGWQLAVAEDAYIFHAQSRSYSHEVRRELCEHADKALAKKHGEQVIAEGVTVCRYDRVLEGMRARSQVMTDRARFIKLGRVLWEGKRVLFLLPIPGVGGGGNVVLDEGAAMRKMGTDVTILNLTCNQVGFERDYPDNTLPVIYVKQGAEISKILSNYDAVIATWCGSVDWLNPSPSSSSDLPVRGYYVQDFEPHFFRESSKKFKMAWDSYNRYPNLVRVTKTEWTRTTVKKKIGVESAVVGPSVNIDLYRPRTRERPDSHRGPLRIAAMIRPSTPHRAPRLTLEILRELYRTHQGSIELLFFGCSSFELRSLGVPNDFPYQNAGILTRPQIASFLNETDIFCDFSTYQAMGLTAMEAMCCGGAVIVPQRGGASSFVKHKKNGIIVDTSSRALCLAALDQLVKDEKLRTRLQRQAMFDICEFFPERAAYNLLQAMFHERAGD